MPWSLWSRDTRTGQFLEVFTGLDETTARGMAERLNRRLGDSDAYQAVPDGEQPTIPEGGNS